MRFVRFPGHASVDDNDIAAGARSWSGGSSDDDLSGKAGDAEGGDEGPEADGDDATISAKLSPCCMDGLGTHA
uniref:Uncharacterized protein n=1 Tax=Zea mays TaxID=4577 RepID=B6TEE2_MAIZE|nr:hypothetical protein [Zea mays]